MQSWKHFVESASEYIFLLTNKQHQNTEGLQNITVALNICNVHTADAQCAKVKSPINKTHFNIMQAHAPATGLLSASTWPARHIKRNKKSRKSIYHDSCCTKLTVTAKHSF